MWLIPLSATLGSGRAARAFCGPYQRNTSNCAWQLPVKKMSFFRGIVALRGRGGVAWLRLNLGDCIKFQVLGAWVVLPCGCDLIFTQPQP